MLSLSGEISRQDVDLQVINGHGDGGVQYGKELMQFAQALASRDEPALIIARNALVNSAGSEVLVDAAAVAGNFQRMVRIADSTGIPVDGMMSALSSSIQRDLSLRRFDSAQNTPLPSLLQSLSVGPIRWLAKQVLRRADSRNHGR